QLGESYQGGIALYAVALVAAYDGNEEEARRAATRGMEISDQIGDRIFEFQNRAVLGFLELSLGNMSAADEVLRRLPPWLVGQSGDEPSLCPGAWPNSIEALVSIGELRLAAEYLDLFQERADRCDCPWALATAKRCLGILRSAEGDLEGAFDAFER